MVPIREGKAGEGTLLIVAEGEIDIDIEFTGEGEDHVPHDCHRAYSDNPPQIRGLASWAVAAIYVCACQHRRQRCSHTSSQLSSSWR